MAKLQSPPVSLLDKYEGCEMQKLYSATVTVTGGEAGHGRASGVAHSDDGNLDVQLRMPKALGGPGGGTNPEQLFAAGYAACFHGALSLLAARAKVPTPGCSVSVTIDFNRDPMDGLFVLSARTLIRMPGVERSIAEELVRSTERFCPYAKMARQGIVNIVTLAHDNETSDG